MIRKVIAGRDLKRAAGSVTKKLSKWLAEKGYVSRAVNVDFINSASARLQPS